MLKRSCFWVGLLVLVTQVPFWGFSQTLASAKRSIPLMHNRYKGKPLEDYEFKIGEHFENFAGYDISTGENLELQDLRGKIVVLNFWFVACRSCRLEMPELNKLTDLYHSNPDIVFLSVCNDNETEVKRFLKTSPFSYRIIANGKAIAKNVGVILFPSNIIIDKNGKVAYSSVGLVKGNTLLMESKISELL